MSLSANVLSSLGSSFNYSSCSSLCTAHDEWRGRSRSSGRGGVRVGDGSVVCGGFDGEARVKDGVSSSSGRASSSGAWNGGLSSHRWIPCRSSRSDRSSTNSRTANGVSSRPWTPSRQNESNYNNSEGSRDDYRSPGRSVDSRDGTRTHSKTYRGSRGRQGGYRRERVKKVRPEILHMRDEQTGELVVVWGVDGGGEVPIPTAADLNWKKSTVALPGDIPDEAWVKAMGGFTPYSVRGVEQRGRGWEDDDIGEIDDEDDEDDDDDDDSESDEDENDLFLESAQAASARVSNPRAQRVKLFGRDLWGNSSLKVKTPAKEEDDATPEFSQTNQSESWGDTQGREDVQRVDVLPELLSNFEYSSEDDCPSDDDVNGGSGAIRNEDDSGEDTRSTPLKNEFSFAEGGLKVAEIGGSSEDREGSISKLGEKSGMGRSRDARIDNVITDVKSKAGKVEDSGKGWKNVVRNDNDFIEGRNKASQSSFNPNIIEIGDRSAVPSPARQQADVKKSNLLDQLRLQVTGRKPKSEEGLQKVIQLDEEPSVTGELSDGIEAPKIHVRESIRPQDLTGRDNYDESIANDFFSLKSFTDLGASPELLKALASVEVKRPSQIQAMSFKPLLEGKSCIIAEQTGSGKTLAYAAPILQSLKVEEAQGLGTKPVSKKPRVLVLVPTGELAAQVMSTFRALSSGGLRCRSIVITGGFKWKTQVESLEGGVDVVVATPGRLLQHLDAGNIQFDNLKTVVLDEVDILFDDEDFSKALQTVNDTSSITVQYIHVTATLPVDIHDNLLDRYPDCMSLMGPNLHRTALGLQEILVDCSGGETDEKTPESAFLNKKTALLQLVEERAVSKTIIFCNKVETCRKVENTLSRYDRTGKKITVLPYHAALSQETRLESLETFMKPQPAKRLFLVCTDRASRGIDSLDVEHVVLFDFPRDPSEYIRRVGRTARGAGGVGKVFVFVVGRQVSQARRIMSQNVKGEPVHDVPGSGRYYYSN